MIDLFNFHAEGSIGIKSLTIADLGLGNLIRHISGCIMKYSHFFQIMHMLRKAF